MTTRGRSVIAEEPIGVRWGLSRSIESYAGNKRQALGKKLLARAVPLA
jgi:hypothetical protein